MTVQVILELLVSLVNLEFKDPQVKLVPRVTLALRVLLGLQDRQDHRDKEEIRDFLGLLDLLDLLGRPVQKVMLDLLALPDPKALQGRLVELVRAMIVLCTYISVNSISVLVVEPMKMSGKILNSKSLCPYLSMYIMLR